MPSSNRHRETCPVTPGTPAPAIIGTSWELNRHNGQSKLIPTKPAKTIGRIAPVTAYNVSTVAQLINR